MVKKCDPKRAESRSGVGRGDAARTNGKGGREHRRSGGETTMSAKRVKSDLKDITPGKRGAAFPHDREQSAPTRKDRWPKPFGSRSDHVPHAVPRGTNEPRGGRDRVERRAGRKEA